MRTTKDRERGIDHRGYGPRTRELERTTGIRYPDWEAPQEQHDQCFVAQVIALMLLKDGDIDKAKAEAMALFRRNSSYERLRSHIELALPGYVE